MCQTAYLNPPLAYSILLVFLRESWAPDDARRVVLRELNDAMATRLLPRDADVEAHVRFRGIADEADV